MWVRYFTQMRFPAGQELLANVLPGMGNTDQRPGAIVRYVGRLRRSSRGYDLVWFGAAEICWALHVMTFHDALPVRNENRTCCVPVQLRLVRSKWLCFQSSWCPAIFP